MCRHLRIAVHSSNLVHSASVVCFMELCIYSATYKLYCTISIISTQINRNEFANSRIVIYSIVSSIPPMHLYELALLI